MPGDYEIQVVFPGGFQATYQGADSVIDDNGYSPVFALSPGGAEIVGKAGLRSMHVTTPDDDPDMPIQNQITLRDAIKTGNNGPPQPAVTFAPNVIGTISPQKALDPINADYNIDGPGATTLTVQGQGNAGNPFRIFTINAGVTSTISGLTIEGGFDTTGMGGGILNEGDLTLNNVVVQVNQTSGDGGGIYNDAHAQLQLQTVTISGKNTATKRGGGLYNSGTVTICCGSVIENNAAGGGGGGIFNDQGTIEAFDDTQILDNGDSGLRGGGVENNLGKFQMYGGTITGNQESMSHGGGVDNYYGTMTLTGVAIQGNSARAYGGGIYTYEGSLTLTNNVTIGGSANADRNFALRGYTERNPLFMRLSDVAWDT